MPVPEPVVVSTGGDLRRNNLLLLLQAIRTRPLMSRSELAEVVGLSVPSVHRLTAELIALGWIEPTEPPSKLSRQGRPTTWFRFRSELAGVVGVDVGSETTRISIGSLTGLVDSTHHVATADLTDDLGGSLARVLRQAHSRTGDGRRPLAAVAVGVPSVVDGAGVLVRPWLKEAWTNLPLRAQLSRRLRCTVTVAQDNHFSARGEASDVGTAPGAGSVLVVELGIGIGAGLALDGSLVPGGHGGLGRLMGWPCVPPRGGSHLGSTLGELITADGLVAQYRWRGGDRDVCTGAALLDAAQSGDTTALTVVRWAGRQLGEVLGRLALMLDPNVIVLGGGLGRGLHGAGLVPELPLSRLRPRPEVRASRLGAEAVVTGALLTAEEEVPAWIANQVTAS